MKLLFLLLSFISINLFGGIVSNSDDLRVIANLREAIIVTMGENVNFNTVDVNSGRQIKETTITTLTDPNTSKTLAVTHTTGNPDYYEAIPITNNLKATFLNLGPTGSLANIDFIFEDLTFTTRTSFDQNLNSSKVEVGYTPVGTSTGTFSENFTFTVAYNVN